MRGTPQIFRVSIHAPVKGRQHNVVVKLSSVGFNPRPREGATTRVLVRPTLTQVSIHAPVKGRHVATLTLLPTRRFNPRPREGATAELAAA